MSGFVSPNIVTSNLRFAVDFNNTRCYPGSGSSVYNLAPFETPTGSTVVTANDSSGTIFRSIGSSSYTFNCSSNPINHEEWSLIIWIKYYSNPTSNYQQFVRLVQPNNSNLYFYYLDTRETTNTYILGAQRDYNDNDWLTYTWNSQSTWTAGDWLCVGVSHNSTVFRHYNNGQFVNTQTQTLETAGYGDLTSVVLNHGVNSGVYIGSFYFYESILTDADFLQNYNAHRARFFGV